MDSVDGSGGSAPAGNGCRAVLRHAQLREGAVPVERKGLLEIVRCERITVGSTQVTDAGEPGIYLEDCSDTVLTGCTVIDSREQKLMPVAVEWNGDGRGNLVTGCRFGSGTAGNPEFPAHVTTHASLLDN